MAITCKSIVLQIVCFIYLYLAHVKNFNREFKSFVNYYFDM